MNELRCNAKKFGEVIDDHTVEIKCRSRFCGYEPGVIILHRFDLVKGTVETKKYREVKEK